MTQLIALPTHNKNHILDWIITKDCDIDTIKNTQVLKRLVSDHHLILFELDAEKPPKKNNLVEPLESAYRKDHSTETALLRVFNDLLVVADLGKVSVLCLLDLSAAFDTLDHNIMLTRLEKSFGIKHTVLQWFQSYLKDREQTAVVDGVKSAGNVLKYGVPQGSVLGPVLFTIYTQPLARVLNYFGLTYHLYADDSQITVHVNQKTPAT
ncbi:reverse transcriptase-like protein [Elysia marginata]|uniref:Reverse transcriptase-like protein n=1 Tax=Elysia marginata TaxID=1093978 RepID=A0AAV4JVS8_9GAST|nr:reverse transcriptase-like protein [Elysia marginata]